MHGKVCGPVGCGLFDESNKGCKAHLGRFAIFCKRKKIGAAAPCGGHTSLNFPEKPEAGTAAEYLKPLVPGSTRFELEEQSANSTENARNAKNCIYLS